MIFNCTVTKRYFILELLQNAEEAEEAPAKRGNAQDRARSHLIWTRKS